MSSDDALQALRQAIKAKATITFQSDSGPCSSLSGATHIKLGDISLVKSTSTRFQKPGTNATDWRSHPDAFYSLEAIVLSWLSKDLAVADYMKQAREAGLAGAFVSVTERKGVVDWLEGKINTHERIVNPDGTTQETTPASQASGAPGPSTHTGDTSTTTPTKKRDYVPDAKDVQVVKKIKLNEVELRDRTTVLRGIKSNNFSSLKDMLTERVKNAKSAPKPGTAAAKPDPKVPIRKPRNLAPIIIISSSPTSLVTMYNVRKFLEGSEFEPPQQAKARMAAEGNHKLDDVIPVYRKRNYVAPGGSQGSSTEKNIKYFVVDCTEALAKFGADAWDRVVCVMTTGQAWQFKPYKWSDPRQLFHNVKGVYVTWSNEPPNPKIQDWNVTELKLDPNRRHVDKSVVAHFWQELDSWITLNKPWLAV